jgi:glycosyltransferase involved in cell wall biosynthesis
VRTPPTWTILVPTLGQRADLFARLLTVLLPQLDDHGGRVRLLCWWSHGYPSIGVIRDRMLAHARSEYVSFVDDDDLVPDYYVAEVVAALQSRPDHVGFKVEYSRDGVVREVIDHSLRYRRWGRNRRGLFRDVTHIDPVRLDVARRGRFAVVHPGQAEDHAWVDQVRRFMRTEEYVDKVMYHYLWSSQVSAWQRPDLIRPVGVRPVFDHPLFAWHPGCAA